MEVKITDSFEVAALVEVINFRLERNKPGPEFIIAKEFVDRLNSLRLTLIYELAHEANKQGRQQK